jgi:hypothetical protein
VSAALPMPEAWTIDDYAVLDGDGVPRRLVQALHDCVDTVRSMSDAIGRKLFAHVPDHNVWQ